MHASAMAARPAVVYFSGATIEGYRAVRELRKRGVPAWFTCDAGPHVKALTDAADAARGRQQRAVAPASARRDLHSRAARRGGASNDRARRAGQSDPVRRVRRAHGAPAIAVAVDRAVVRADAQARASASPFVAARSSSVRTATNGGRPTAAGAASASTRPRSTTARSKLGLGSSAAVTCRGRRLALRAGASRALADRAPLFAVADAAHAEAQGTRGSGVDVACSVYGGAIRFRAQERRARRRAPVDLPDGVRLTFVWAGSRASTAELIGRVKALAEAIAVAPRGGHRRASVSQAHAFASAVTGQRSRRARSRGRRATARRWPRSATPPAARSSPARTRSWRRSRAVTAARPSRRAPAAATSASPSPSATTPPSALREDTRARRTHPAFRSALPAPGLAIGERMTRSSRIPGFYKLLARERRKKLAAAARHRAGDAGRADCSTKRPPTTWSRTSSASTACRSGSRSTSR